MFSLDPVSLSLVRLQQASTTFVKSYFLSSVFSGGQGVLSLSQTEYNCRGDHIISVSLELDLKPLHVTFSCLIFSFEFIITLGQCHGIGTLVVEVCNECHKLESLKILLMFEVCSSQRNERLFVNMFLDLFFSSL